MKFRKKPVVIDAVQFLGDWYVLPSWAKDATKKPTTLVHTYLEVETLEGWMRCNVSDWLNQRR